MSDSQHRFYLEQAALCDRAALAAKHPVEKIKQAQAREAWLALARSVAPRTGRLFL